MDTNNISYTKGKEESAVDFMIRIVKTWISNGTYKSGDRLPSEAELVSLTGISRGSVREAMKILSALGIVEVKQGNGTYITEEYVTPLIEPMLLKLTKSSWSAKDLMDFREMIERSIVEIIIRNANDDDLLLLEDCNNKIKIEIENDCNTEKLVELDIEFHRQLAKCTRNSLFDVLYNFTLDFISVEISNLYHENDSMGYISYLLHQRIVDSLKRRDLATATATILEAMQNHVKRKSNNKPET